MRKHHSAAHARARTTRTCLGIITSSFVLIGLTACGGGSDTAPANDTAQPQNLTDGPARAQAISTPALGTSIQDTGWNTALPELPPRVFEQPASISGTTYYIDALRTYVDGQTPNANEDGLTPATAFTNIGQFKKQIVATGLLKSNDAILLKCGAVFRNETLYLNGASNLYIGPYKAGQAGSADCADGTLPTLRQAKWGGGFGWTATDASNTVYSAPTPLYPGTSNPVVLTRLFRYTIPLVKARYPNIGSDGAPQYLLATSVSSTTQFKVSTTDQAMLGTVGNDIVGADISIRSTPWLIERRKVTAYAPATGLVTINRAVSGTIDNSAGYYLAGKPWMFDQQDEWYQNTTDNKVYFRPAQASDISNLEYTDNSNYLEGLSISNGSNITISRVAFTNQEFSALKIEGSTNVKVSGVEVRYASELGISVGRSTANGASQNITIEFCKVRGVRGYGIRAGGRDGSSNLLPSRNVILRNNLVTETGMHEAAVVSNQYLEVKDMTAIRLGGLANDASPPSLGSLDAQALGNIVINSAGPGIFLDNGRHGAVIDSNTVINACMRTTDCGGIQGNNTSAAQLASENTTSAQISNNIVIGVKGSTVGLPGAPTSRLGREQTYGIYLDDGSANVDVFNNQISHASGGVFLHNTAWTKVHHNQIKQVAFTSILAKSDRVQVNGIEVMRGNIIHDNKLFSHRAVDAGVLAGSSLIPLSEGIQGDAPQVYAQMWLHQSLNPSVFFTGDRRNESRNNTVITHSKVTVPSTWRTNSRWVVDNGTPQTTQSSGGIWLLQTPVANGYKKEIALPDWLKVTQADAFTADVESSRVSYRPYVLTLGNSGNSLVNPLVPGSGWSWNAASQVPYTNGASTCGEASVCAGVTASQTWHTLLSNNFQTNAGTLYFLKYTLKQGPVKGVHNATVRRITDSALAGEYLQNVYTNPDELRYYEHFFRGNTNSGANTVIALKPSDGVSNSPNPYTTQYFSDASVHQVDAADVLPPLDQLGATAANASAVTRTFRCVEDLGFAQANCSSVRDESNQSVTFPVSVEARTMKRFYINSSRWSN